MSDISSESNQEPINSAAGALELARRAVHDGATDARDAAAKAWVAGSRFASRFVYTTCYTVSYGVVFPTTLLARAIPRDNAAVQGLIDGAHAARERAGQVHLPSLELPAGLTPPAIVAG
jgi:hypothetical protein